MRKQMEERRRIVEEHEARGGTVYSRIYNVPM
jgi:hypothetical protein